MRFLGEGIRQGRDWRVGGQTSIARGWARVDMGKYTREGAFYHV